MKFRNKTKIAFDIGSKNIKIVTGYRKGNILYLDNYSIEPLLNSTLSDSKIINSSEITRIITKYINKNKVGHNSGFLTISPSQTIHKIIKIPKINMEMLKEVVKHEWKHLLPESSNDYIVDYAIVDEYCQDNNANRTNMIKVLIVAAPKDLINSYLTLFQQCGVELQAIDIQSNCIAKVINFINHKNEVLNCIILDLGYSKTTLTAVQDGKLCFFSVIETRVVEDLISEVYQAIGYFKSIVNSNILQIYLIGGGALNNDTVETFKSAFDEPFTILNDMNTWNIEYKKDFPEIIFLWNAIGILLREN